MSNTLSHIPEPKRALFEQLVARLTPVRAAANLAQALFELNETWAEEYQPQFTL